MNPNFPIHTIKNTFGDKVSFSPRRGGMVTELTFSHKEIFYFDKVTFGDKKLNVRGGIPILFPNAGAISDKKFPLLKQHGFARNSSHWHIDSVDENSFTESLTQDKQTKKIYPFDFRLEIKGVLEHNSFTLQTKIENLETKSFLPIATGLHPYFKIKNEIKKEIKFKGIQLTKEEIDYFASGGTVVKDNPKTKNLDDSLEIDIPDIDRLKIEASPEYQKIWIWSQPEKDFICIEPMMRDLDGFSLNPSLLEPKTNLSLQYKVTFLG